MGPQAGGGTGSDTADWIPRARAGRGAGEQDEAGLDGNSDLAVGGGTPWKDFSSVTRPSDLYSRRSRHKGDGLGVGKTGYYGCPREK